jgi:hypothetical protein
VKLLWQYQSVLETKLKVDVPFFFDGEDEDRFWSALVDAIPGLCCIDAGWNGNGFPPLSPTLRDSPSTSVTLWLPSNETNFVKGSNHLLGLLYSRSLLRDGMLLSGRLAVATAAGQEEHERFAESVLSVLVKVSERCVWDLVGRHVKRYRIGGSARRRVETGEITLRDRGTASLFLTVGNVGSELNEA